MPAPHRNLRGCIVVPARNEETSLPRLVDALAAQRDLDGHTLDASVFEIVLLLNNCTDQSVAAARVQKLHYPALAFHLMEVSFTADEAHVGRARQILFDIGLTRFQQLDRPDGVILTTDADSRPGLDWIARTHQEIDAGADGVGGRVLLEPDDLDQLVPAVRRLFLLDIGYRRALEEMRSLYAPDDHDPFPRHHQHFGASLAGTAGTYARVGGMPLVRTSEDVALYRAIVQGGGRFRHSSRVRVHTSARAVGRAEGGLADAIRWWHQTAAARMPVMVESAADADVRLASLGRWCRDHPDSAPPDRLITTPQPTDGEGAEIQSTLRQLRTRLAVLGSQPLAVRLAIQDRANFQRCRDATRNHLHAYADRSCLTASPRLATAPRLAGAASAPAAGNSAAIRLDGDCGATSG